MGSNNYYIYASIIGASIYYIFKPQKVFLEEGCTRIQLQNEIDNIANRIYEYYKKNYPESLKWYYDIHVALELEKKERNEAS